eukprot:CAMPEP_0172535650 /NCGR_PEP_ID=MMETSP1067-20121228/7562_1 /TAXON_ID=265564 ORGANISM="Thalassiosira punctigera, Strain Tpunct2005C2" /NCGR_SAMPLE_ID=MMETSP1067 /ASSEMBLY_ACC=CAM_ASM_000444 /LENGTH=235 /DNA_ID=CAMNT_0013320591 /DNA_START=44 /DNA_END=751 /DNA_ORIENTATION=+
MMQSTHSSSSHPSANMASASAESPDAKVLRDLSALTEQIDLCQSMLANAGDLSSIESDEALLAVIGFLEACVPRVVELIEAAAQGALGAEAFERCLVANDRLTNVLADVEKDPRDRRPLTPAATAASSAESTTGGHQGADIGQGMKKLSVAGGDSDVKLGGKTTGLEEGASKPAAADPFAGGPDLLAPTPPVASDQFKISDSMGSAGSAEAAAKTATADNDDDFDAFFRDRTSGP